MCQDSKVAAECLLQFAKAPLQMVRPSTEKIIEEEQMRGLREGKHRGDGLTSTLSWQVYILGVWCLAEKSSYVYSGQDRRCFHVYSLKQ